MYYFCTYFDKNYLGRGLVLIDSMRKHCTPFKIYILCLDADTFDYFQKKDTDVVIPIPLSTLEQKDKGLFGCKSNRSVVEYFFTLSPCLPLYILENYGIDHIAYLDSDMYFYSSVEPLFKELGSKSVYIIPHRFPEKYKTMEEAGIFNVGFQIFKNDKTGLACLKRWREQCIEWCYDKLDKDRYADQKYLDEWPKLYGDGLVISSHPGANLAPWNVGGFELSLKDGKVKVDARELIFYHFHRFRFIKPRLVAHGLDNYFVEPGPVLRNHIYAPYMGAMIRTNKKLKRTSDVTGRIYQKYNFKEIKNRVKRGHTFFYIKDHWCLWLKWRSYH
jgi:hypothetical protein